MNIKKFEQRVERMMEEFNIPPAVWGLVDAFVGKHLDEITELVERITSAYNNDDEYEAAIATSVIVALGFVAGMDYASGAAGDCND